MIMHKHCMNIPMKASTRCWLKSLKWRCSSPYGRQMEVNDCPGQRALTAREITSPRYFCVRWPSSWRTSQYSVMMSTSRSKSSSRTTMSSKMLRTRTFFPSMTWVMTDHWRRVELANSRIGKGVTLWKTLWRPSLAVPILSWAKNTMSPGGASLREFCASPDENRETSN